MLTVMRRDEEDDEQEYAKVIKMGPQYGHAGVGAGAQAGACGAWGEGLLGTCAEGCAGHEGGLLCQDWSQLLLGLSCHAAWQLCLWGPIL